MPFSAVLSSLSGHLPEQQDLGSHFKSQRKVFQEKYSLSNLADKGKTDTMLHINGLGGGCPPCVGKVSLLI